MRVGCAAEVDVSVSGSSTGAGARGPCLQKPG